MRFNIPLALSVAFAFAVTAMAPITTAEAACANCKPASKTVVKTNYQYKTVQKVNTVTRYKDVKKVKVVNKVNNVTKNNYVNVVNRTITVTRVQPVTRVNVVTRIQPITKVNTITRVKKVTIFQNKSERVGRTETLRGKTLTSHKTIMLAAKTVGGSNKTIAVNGGSRTVSCGCR